MKLKKPTKQAAQLLSIIFIVVAAFSSGVFVGADTPFPAALTLEWILIMFLFGYGFLTEAEG